MTSLKERVDDLEKKVDAIARLIMYQHKIFQELGKELEKK
jgi:tetrahydromethanopterin S-methyltransferase subunit G